MCHVAPYFHVMKNLNSGNIPKIRASPENKEACSQVPALMSPTMDERVSTIMSPTEYSENTFLDNEHNKCNVETFVDLYTKYELNLSCLSCDS